MKKILIALMLCAGYSHAASRPYMNQPSYSDVIGPAVSQTNSVSIATPSVVGARVCLTDLRVSILRTQNQGNITVAISDGFSTIYNLDASTGNPVQMSWTDADPLCSGPNRGMNITSVTTAAGSTINTNYKGFSY